MTSKYVLRNSPFSVWQRWTKDDDFTTKKKNKNWQKIWTKTSQIRYSKANNYMRRCSYFLSSGKYKLKPKWYASAYVLHWLKVKILTIPSGDEDLQQ